MHVSYIYVCAGRVRMCGGRSVQSTRVWAGRAAGPGELRLGRNVVAEALQDVHELPARTGLVKTHSAPPQVTMGASACSWSALQHDILPFVPLRL